MNQTWKFHHGFKFQHLPVSFSGTYMISNQHLPPSGRNSPCFFSIKKLGGGNSNLCYFHEKLPGGPRSLGEMIQFDEHIFQMGWFNHQLETSKAIRWFEAAGALWKPRVKARGHGGKRTCGIRLWKKIMQQQKSMEKCRLTCRGWAQLWYKNTCFCL